MSEVKRFYIMPGSVPVLLSDAPAYTPMTNHATDIHTTQMVLASDYAALRAENERLRDDYSEACDDAMAVARKLRAAESELAALKAVPEEVEVVAWMKHELCTRLYFHAPPEPSIPLMTVAQHNAIVAALSAPTAGQDQKPIAYLIQGGGMQVSLQYKELPAWANDPALTVTPLYEGTGQDVSALVEALEKCAASLAWNCFGECRAIHAGPIMPATEALELAKAALAANKAGGGE